MSNINHEEVKEKIVSARVSLLLKQPFWGNLVTRLKMQEGWEGLKTAATDGRHIYYDVEFFHKLTVKQIEFVLCHEVLHAALDHMGRCESRDRSIFNIAADYAVNGILVKEKIGQQPPAELKIFHDPKYYDMSTEEIYDRIYDTMDEQQLMALGQLLDEHLDAEGDGSDDGSNGNGRPRLTKEQLRAIRDEFKEAMIQAGQAAGAGNVPAALARMIKSFTEPKMSWRELLRQRIQSTFKDRWTYSRPNKKGYCSNVNFIIPSRAPSDTIDVAVALDLSGSICEEQIRDFMGEVKGIMQEYQDFKIKMMTFDTQIYNEQDYDAYNMDEFDEYPLKGGGGTEFRCIWEHFINNDINPKYLIVFSDMYDFGDCGSQYADYCPTVFINHGRPGYEAPHGVTVEYTRD